MKMVSAWCMVLLFAASAHAVPVGFHFQGVYDDLCGHMPVETDEATFSGSIHYDTEDIGFAERDFIDAVYYMFTGSMDIDVPIMGISYRDVSLDGILVWEKSIMFMTSDRQTNDLYICGWHLTLENSSQALSENLNLPTAIDFSTFQGSGSYFDLGGPHDEYSYGMGGHITDFTPAPEPGTFLLLALGVLGIGLRRRKRSL